MTGGIVELNIEESDQKEIATLQSLVVTQRTTLTRLIGADFKPREGLFNKKLETLISTCNSYPVLSAVEKASLSSSISQLSWSAEKAKSDFCESLNDTTAKFFTLSVAENQENTLNAMILQYNKALIRAYQCVAIFCEVLKTRISKTDIQDDLFVTFTYVGCW